MGAGPCSCSAQRLPQDGDVEPQTEAFVLEQRANEIIVQALTQVRDSKAAEERLPPLAKEATAYVTAITKLESMERELVSSQRGYVESAVTFFTDYLKPMMEAGVCDAKEGIKILAPGALDSLGAHVKLLNKLSEALSTNSCPRETALAIADAMLLVAPELMSSARASIVGKPKSDKLVARLKKNKRFLDFEIMPLVRNGMPLTVDAHVYHCINVQVYHMPAARIHKFRRHMRELKKFAMLAGVEKFDKVQVARAAAEFQNQLLPRPLWVVVFEFAKEGLEERLDHAHDALAEVAKAVIVEF